MILSLFVTIFGPFVELSDVYGILFRERIYPYMSIVRKRLGLNGRLKHLAYLIRTKETSCLRLIGFN